MIHELTLLPQTRRAPAVAKEVPHGFGLRYDSAHSHAHVLSDGFGRQHTYLRIALVERCNLRCRYCMPEEGLDWTPQDRLLTAPEIIRLARLFVNQGVTKIRLTGGEPLLRADIVEIAQALGGISGLRTLAITTNGLLLGKKLDRLRAAGVRGYNISLDTLRADRFEEVTRRRGLPLVLGAIRQALRTPGVVTKVNCVVMRGFNEDELAEFVAMTRDASVEVRFLEFMPFDGNRWDARRMVSYQQMLALVRRFYPLERLLDQPDAVSKTYRVPGFRGTVGFITSMTDNFCEGCNRLRITADGNLKVCLFGSAEVSLRDLMRGGAADETLLQVISRAVGRKRARHAGMHNLATMANRPMIMIGG